MINGFIMSFISLVCLAWFTNAYALSLNEGGGTSPHSWQLSQSVSYIKYKEPSVMEEKGWFSTWEGGYTFTADALLLGLESRIGGGEVDYTSANTGSMDNLDDFLCETRGLIGYSVAKAGDWAESSGVACIPYSGLGYRYLNDDSSGMVSTTGAGGYERESNYLYIPLGLQASWKPNGNNGSSSWKLAGFVEYDIFLWGRQFSRLSDVNSGYTDLVNDQYRGYGLRGALNFSVTMPSVGIFMEPYVTYWSIRRSERNIYYNGTAWKEGYEPKNNSTEIGCKLGVRF